LDRKNGVATRLIEGLVSFGEKNGYLSISARVAADLPANDFWGKAGFQIARQEAGGRVTQRRINLRVRDLNTPSLFGRLEASGDLAVGKVSDVRYSHGVLSSGPVYVLDLNVFLDVVKDRIFRKDASFLIQAGLNHQARVCVTPECAQELARHSNKSSSDPVLEFAKEVPTLPTVGDAILDGLVRELRTLVFPGSTTAGQHSANIESDLTHLAYCVHHRATGFVTRDQGILRVAEELRKAHCLEVLSPTDLFQAAKVIGAPRQTVRAKYGQGNLRVVVPAEEGDRRSVEGFLADLGVAPDTGREVWSPGTSGSPRRRIAVWRGETLLGVASWDPASRLKQVATLHVHVDERCEEAEGIAECLLDVAIRDTGPFQCRLMNLRLIPGQDQVRAVALRKGFAPQYAPSSSTHVASLAKFIFSGPISPRNWDELRAGFERLTTLRLPERLPTLDELMHTGMCVGGGRGRPTFILKLFDFETLISPGLVLCPGRTGLIIPIQERFARHLLGMACLQLEIFPSPEAILHGVKAYFRNPRRSDIFTVGSPILFYVSGRQGGSREIIGSARLVSSEVLELERLTLQIERQGVLTQKELKVRCDTKGRIHAITFDGFNLLPTRIPYDYLKRGRFISGANLVTAEAISYETLFKLYLYGYGS